jgi:excisionase family DNA binding protein
MTGLTVKESAYFLGISPKTVYGWCKKGSVDFFREGKSIRIEEKNLLKLIITKEKKYE